MIRRILFVSLAALVVLTGLSAAGVAAPWPAPSAGTGGAVVDKGDGPGGVSALAANTATPDAYEEDGDFAGVPWDDLRNIEPLLTRLDGDYPGWGTEPYTEQHTIDLANATQWDEDWFKFVVPTADFDDFTQLSYRFDAYSTNRDVDLVLDVYADGVGYSMADAVIGTDPAALVSNDNSRWVNPSDYDAYGRWSSVTFIPPAAGTYWIRVRPFDYPSDGFTGGAGAYTFRAKAGQVVRLAGADRVSTAVRISQEGWPTMPADSQDTTVVVAFSKNYPDALAAASLAGACGSPILLTPGDTLPVSVAAEVARIGAKAAYVIGGTAVISEAVVEDLESVVGAGDVKRIAGADRYATSVEILKETKAVREANGSSLPTDAFLVSGKNFPDALAVGPVAYYTEAPILLTNPTTLNPAVASAIAMYGINDIIIAGGTAAVAADVYDALVDDGIPPNRILRVAGSNRYETAKEIAAWACDMKGPGVHTDYRIGTTNNATALPALPFPYLNAFASGESYPDALSGGAFAGKAGAPVLLTPKSFGTPFLFGADGEIPPGSTQWFADLSTAARLPIRQSYLLGGPAAVTDGVFGEIDNNTGWAGGP